ncbi:uncharacterized protein M437DRAFT_64156 [Aureobasidium melanogenum CBS 110374]|uniref:F-box domain-containing protein n=1 Tax=Aureobasidium melanogenum (strain CBS 110374) TaxID=1043003 RepID=A0A074VZ00_AURM1|nr:uncharacterized protein M437DRAFT_64156 [Aureobasidium melanogenum CBS 110374]KEQ64504.1 hypothetical protein M437DRAFT_64156 [Aureobasidium melanogenum CBS 110374]
MIFERLPSELQLMVMSYLDPPTLYAMAQVNTVWNAYAVDQLWAQPPEKALTHIAAMVPKSRRRVLANKVRKLSLRGSEPSFQEVKFGSLRSLSFVGSDHVNPASFIQPSLRSLGYWGDHTFTDKSISLVHRRCPDLHSLRVYDPSLTNSALLVNFLQTRRCLKLLDLYELDQRIVDDVLAGLVGPISETLEDLRLHGPLDHVNPSHLLQFVQSTRVLRKVSVSHLPSDISELLSALCDLDSLQELALGHWITFEHLAFLDQQQCNILPFRNVRDLNLNGDAQALSRLLSSRSITVLKLEVQHPNESFYTAIGNMVQLTKLDLTLPPSENVGQEDLGKLRMLRRLRRLRMSKPYDSQVLEELQLPWMTDSLFEEFVASYPLLEQLLLHWDVGDQLTEAAIGGLAKSCPRLKDMTLRWNHNLEDWYKLKHPLFPRMEWPSLGSICEFPASRYNEALERAEPFAAMLRSLMPVMTRIYISSDSLSAAALCNTLFPGSVTVRDPEDSDW